jgi:hypothetical protein
VAFVLFAGDGGNRRHGGGDVPLRRAAEVTDVRELM